jgi:hypothetical protein
MLHSRDTDTRPCGRVSTAVAGYDSLVLGRPVSSEALGAVAGRRWTRLGALGIGAHVFYELAAGVGMPLASRLGPRAAAVLWGAGTVVTFREAGRQPHSRDSAFVALNAAFLSAVIAHFAGWPRTRVVGLPWLTECEGLTGPVIAPYNVILYVSGAAALGGLVENKRGRVLGVAVPVVLVPLLIGGQRREFSRLRAQARRHPGWWNRRLRTADSSLRSDRHGVQFLTAYVAGA